MNLIIFFLSFFMLCIASSLIVTSWFIVTRGTIEKMPDGTLKKTGKIFREWSFFWLQKNGETYRFPEKIRDMVAGCITCHPTIYGNFCYVIFITFFNSSIIYNDLFYYFQNPIAGIVIIGLAHWMSLSWICTVMWKIYNK